MTAWEGLAEVYELGFYGWFVFLLWATTGPMKFSFWIAMGQQMNEAERNGTPPKLLFILTVITSTALWPIAAIKAMTNGPGNGGKGNES